MPATNITQILLVLILQKSSHHIKRLNAVNGRENALLLTRLPQPVHYNVKCLVTGHVTVSVRLQFSSVEVTVRTSDLRFAGLASNVLLAHTVFPDKIFI